MSEALLAVAGLTVAYAGVDAVHDITLAVPAGRIVTVVGPNGAGKTTLLHAIMGILAARQGAVRFAGAVFGRAPVEARVQGGLSLVPERRELFASLSVQDNLRLGFYPRRREGRPAGRAGLQSVFALFPRLAERRRQLAGTLSGGERQMLAMGRALMARPRLLMLDEPSLGLAPLIVREVFSTIAGLREAGVSVLLVEQNARAALRIADYAYVLEGGRITLEGADLARDARVTALYMGGAAA